MKITLRKLFLLVMMLTVSLCEAAAQADTITIDNLRYLLDENKNTATVTKTPTATGNITIPKTVTYNNVKYTVNCIGDSAFRYCKNLNSVIINADVTKIGTRTFEFCESLASIDIPNSVTAIGESAFNCCHKLTSITIPESVTEIGKFAFVNCTSFTSIKIPKSVTSIGTWTFAGCKKLTSITIPESVTEIGDGAFLNCNSLASINIPNSVTAIGESAFNCCHKLTSITIPESVTEIGDRAFEECTALALITIPTSVTKIGDWTFAYCSSLANITIPNSVTLIEDNAFYKCTSLASITIPTSVTKIESSAFEGCTALASITIPTSVTEIEDKAFWECTNLTSIILPESVTTIGAYVFGNCSALTSATILGSGKNIFLNGTFTECTALTSVTLSNSVCGLLGATFENCTSLTSITIPESVTSIHIDTFEGCTSLSSISLLTTTPPTLKGYGSFSIKATIDVPVTAYEAYKSADGWKDLNIVAAKQILEQDGLKFEIDTDRTVTLLPNNYTGDITVPEKITVNGKEYTVSKVGDDCFNNCSGNITLPSTITEIGKNDFSKVKSITINATEPPTLATGTTLPEGTTLFVPADSYEKYKNVEGWKNANVIGVTEDGKLIAEKDGFKFELDPTTGNATLLPNNYTGNVIVPEKVTINGKEYTVTKIGDGCFENCSGITSITLPSTITEIGKNDMSGDTSLKDITINSTTPPTVDEGTKIPEGTTITVPEGSYDSYKNNDSWKDKDIVGKSEDGNIITIIDGLKYELHTGDKTATLLPNNYTGDVVVPATVTYNGETYTVTKIGDGCFDNCSGITSITLPSTITEIGKNDMSGDTSLKDITINSTTPPTVDEGTKIPEGTTITVPEDSYDSYKDAEGWKDKDIVGKSEDGNIITIIDGFKYELHTTDKTATLLPNNYTGDVVVPATVTYNGEEYTVTKIGDGCFENCSGITSITLPSTITEIGKNDMSGDTNLKDITINSTTPPTVDEGTKIPEGTTITVPEGSYDSYKNNDSWKDKDIVGKSEEGNIITVIDGFKYELHPTDKTATLLPNNYTGNVVVPEKVTYNGVEYTVTKIGDGCFENCSGITSITLPSTITEIGKNDMSGDTNLKDITINSTTPPTVDEGTKIPEGTTITVPEGSYDSYKNNDSWKDKDIVGKSEDGNIITIIDGFKYELHPTDKTATLLPNNYTGDVVVPATVTYNGETYTVTKIGDGCFDNCSGITSITLPSTITEIGKNDMSGDTNLKEITINSTTPPTVDEGTKIPEGTTITVPEGSYDSYKDAEGWKDKNIQAPATKIDYTVESNDIQVDADGHNIVVKGASDNTRMSIVTTEGRLIYQGSVRNVEIHTAGLYIVRINHTVTKILIR